MHQALTFIMNKLNVNIFDNIEKNYSLNIMKK